MSMSKSNCDTTELSRDNVIVVAPYCPAHRPGLTSLGSSAKISNIVTGFLQNNYRVYLLNSAHQLEALSRTTIKRSGHCGGKAIEIIPPTLPNRKIGKLLQCILSPFTIVSIINKKKPKYLWLYNPYVYEILCLILSKITSPHIISILEYEDLPLSRRRAGTGWLKNWLDHLAAKIALRLVDGVTVVQTNMIEPRRGGLLAWHLPVLVEDDCNQVKQLGPTICIGYFGGLHIEKGVDVLLEVIRQRPRGDIRWIICGSGPLSVEVASISHNSIYNLLYISGLNRDAFNTIYRDVDVIINLHKPLDGFSNGIFPYKLLEAVSKGKLLISTPMSGCPDEVAGAIHWLTGDVVKSAVDAISRIESIERTKRENIREAQAWVNGKFTSKTFIKTVTKDLSERNQKSSVK